MKSRRSLVVLVAAGLAGALLMPTPAHADEDDCPNNYICMWEDPWFVGSMYVKQPAKAGNYEIGAWNGDNEISSLRNKTNLCVRLYDNDGWSGTSRTFGKDAWEGKLELRDYDNEAESFSLFAC
jgi:hypothetical protein